MTHPLFVNSQAWAVSLRQLMGYPAHAAAGHAIRWCTSTPRDLSQAMQITQIANDSQCDLVHLAFEDHAAEPVGVSLAVRQNDGVAWLAGARLYAAAEFATIELLAGDRRWQIGPRHVLTAAKLPPTNRRARGEEIAMRRWRKAAAAIGPVELVGSLWVPPGGSYADAIPHARLDIAA